MRSFILLIGMMVMSAAAYADTFEWTDSQGGVHFTDNLDKVPARYMNKVRKVDVNPVIQKSEKQSSAAPEKENAGPLFGGHNENWWRSKFRAPRDEIKMIQDNLPEKRERLTSLHHHYFSVTKPGDRAAINDLKAEIDKDEARIIDLQKQLADLDVEASKAGVPNEWRQ